MSVNRVVLTGNLTCEPELRRTQSGMSILSLGIAVNDRRKNSQTGEWEDCANFVDCTMFGTQAEAVCNFLHKGSKVGIDGKLRYSSWERDGQKRSKLEVVVDDLELLTPKGQGGSSGQYQPQAGGYAAPQQGGGGYATQAGYNAQNQGQPNNYTTQQGYAPQTGSQQPQNANYSNAPQQNHQQGIQYQAATPSMAAAAQVEAPSIYDDDIPF